MHWSMQCLRHSNPPYLIHKGKRLIDDLQIGCSPGCGFNISQSGWSNSSIFQTYLQTHFLRYVQRQKGNHVLLVLLYDGSTTHINRELVEWALSEEVILFVLPPHSSHHLQPLDVSSHSKVIMTAMPIAF